MADITTLLSLQARSRRNALRASRALHLARAQRAEAERAMREAAAVDGARTSVRLSRTAAGAQR